MECVYCKSENVVKDGIFYGRQRYWCKGCDKTFRTGERRQKYSQDIKIKIIKSYLNGVGFRAISRIFEVPLSVVFYLIKNTGQRLESLKGTNPPDSRIIQVLEADEVFTYIGENTKWRSKNEPNQSVDPRKPEHKEAN